MPAVESDLANCFASRLQLLLIFYRKLLPRFLYMFIQSISRYVRDYHRKKLIS